MAQKWVRVKDKRTGHEYSVTHVDERHHEVLENKQAVSKSGRPLPAKHYKKPAASKAEAAGEVKTTGQAAEKKEGSK